MARERTIEIAALNIAANPHPEGTYIHLLRLASNFLVKARGSDYAKITSAQPSERSETVFTGRILMWTEIDVEGRWIDLRNEGELPQEIRDSISIPENARPNYRTFDYVFDDDSHTLYFESRNEFGDRLGPTTARRIFGRMLSRELLGPDEPEVQVTVLPEANAVDKILALPSLRTLYIRVARPNADSSSPRARQRVFSRLDQMHAQRLEQRYVKSADAERLTPTEEVRELAEVAADHGVVRGEGRDDNGKKLEVSTEQHPKIWQVSMGAGDSFLRRLLSQIKLF